MYGMQTVEFILFLKQLGVVVAGAGALWGLVFAIHNRRETNKHRCLIYDWISGKLLIPFTGGFILALLAAAALYTTLPVFAHEGVVIAPTLEHVAGALELTSPLFLFWIVFTPLALLYMERHRQKRGRLLPYFFAAQFVIAFLISSLHVWTGELSRAQFFFFGHGFHSIFTLGTVLVLDFLFLISASSDYLKRHIYPFFPTLSKVIWVGLGLDFLSVALVFEEAIALTPKSFFMQTIIGIIIINGVLLSGPLTRALLKSVRQGGAALSRHAVRLANISGIISVSSWTTITFVDFFHEITLSYAALLGVYTILAALVFLGHELWQRLHPPLPAFLRRDVE